MNISHSVVNDKINSTDNSNTTSSRINDDNTTTLTTTESAGSAESQIEYSLCGLFSILYPFSLNFNSVEGIQNKESLIPKLENLPTWNDLTEQSEYLNQLSSHSDMSEDDTEMSDVSSSNSNSQSQSPRLLNSSDNKQNNKSSKVPIKKPQSKLKKLFIGGINFDDLILPDEMNLKNKRISIINSIFHGFGKVTKLDAFWDKGYLFVFYQNAKDAQAAHETFSSPAKKKKLFRKYRDRLNAENQSTKSVPSPNIYVRFPTNHKKQ